MTKKCSNCELKVNIMLRKKIFFAILLKISVIQKNRLLVQFPYIL